MKQVTYFYNYDAFKKDTYNKFNCGTFTVDVKNDSEISDVFNFLLDKANKEYPDNDTINVNTLNRL